MDPAITLWIESFERKDRDGMDRALELMKASHRQMEDALDKYGDSPWWWPFR